jgi:manganese efflux pump family protein
MNWIVSSLLLGVGLSMDCLALSVTDGLVYQDLGKKKPFFIAFVFAFLQALFPLIGFLLGETFYNYIKEWDHWVAFSLLVLIGGKMLFDGIKGLVKPETREPKKFSYPEVLLQGVADSIDAFAIGLAIRSTLKVAPDAGLDYEIYICFVIVMLVTFVISLFGVFAGKWINKLLKGKYEISEIIGGVVLIAIAIEVVITSYI